MVVVQEEYIHLGQEEKKHQQQSPKTKKQPKPKSRKLEKVIFATCLGLVLMLSLLLLLGYTSITEARHRVHRLGYEVEQLEVQKEHLRIQAEQVSKSRWIEQEATERLNLQYPTSQQINYIYIDPTQVALVNQAVDRHMNSYNEDDLLQENSIQRVVGKIVSIFKS